MSGPRVLRLSDVSVGQVYLMSDPVRIVHIDGETSITVSGAESGKTGMMPAVKVTATLPTMAISGAVSHKQVKQNIRILQALMAVDDRDDDDLADDTSWTEIWSERQVHPIGHVRGGIAAILDETRWITQAYVHEVEGRKATRNRTSPIQGKALEGELIPASLVPDELFKNIVERITPAILQEQLARPVGVVAVPISNLPTSVPYGVMHPEPTTVSIGGVSPASNPTITMNIAQLKSVAKQKGVDISDISGPGSNQKIIERLAGLN